MRRQGVLVRLQPGVLSRGRSSSGRATERHSEEARSSRAVRLFIAQVRGVTGASRAPTSLVRVRILAGLPFLDSSRAEAARLSLVRGLPRRACGSTPHPDRTPRPRRHTSKDCCGPERFRLSPRTRQVAGSNPARGFPCPGSSVEEQLRRSAPPRPQQNSHRLSPLRADARRFSVEHPVLDREVVRSNRARPIRRAVAQFSACTP